MSNLPMSSCHLFNQWTTGIISYEAFCFLFKTQNDGCWGDYGCLISLPSGGSHHPFNPTLVRRCHFVPALLYSTMKLLSIWFLFSNWSEALGYRSKEPQILPSSNRTQPNPLLSTGSLCWGLTKLTSSCSALKLVRSLLYKAKEPGDHLVRQRS